MTDKFDVIVLGTGSAGGKVAHTCRQAGWKVAVIESGSPGGTCAQRGCDAKKPLVNAAGIIAAVQRLQGLGISGDAAVDWQDLIAFKKTFTDPIAQQEREHLDKDGIELIEGDAHFLNGDTLQINR